MQDRRAYTLSDFDYALPQDLIAATHADAKRKPPARRPRRFARRPAFRRSAVAAARGRPRDPERHARHPRTRAWCEAVRRPRGDAIERIVADDEAWVSQGQPFAWKPGGTVDSAAGLRAEVVERPTYFSPAFPRRRQLADWLERHGEVPLPPYITQPTGRTRGATITQSIRARWPLPATPFRRSDVRRACRAWRGDRVPTRRTSARARSSGSATEHLRSTACIAKRSTFRKPPCEDPQTREHGGGSSPLAQRRCGRSNRRSAMRFRAAGVADTSLFMTPGSVLASSTFSTTNFHLPRSTLRKLVSAFAGYDEIRAAYAHAIRERYRFFSYGDAKSDAPQTLKFARLESPDDLTFRGTEGHARRGQLTLAHGVVQTPMFCRSARTGPSRRSAPNESAGARAQVVLGNTFHLWLRPGAEAHRHFTAADRFTGWHGPILTDSGGFQVFNLGRCARSRKKGDVRIAGEWRPSFPYARSLDAGPRR